MFTQAGTLLPGIRYTCLWYLSLPSFQRDKPEHVYKMQYEQRILHEDGTGVACSDATPQATYR